MAIEVRIEKDSINPYRERLTTFVCTVPNYLLAELNTHRQLSRNAASSRAIPIEAMLDKVWSDTFLPQWTRAKKGMQGDPATNPAWISNQNLLAYEILSTTDRIVRQMLENGVHKQNANRYLEPFVYVDWIVSGTEWANLFAQRVHPDAEPHFQEIAYKMAKLWLTEEPIYRTWGEWHLPFIEVEEKAQLHGWKAEDLAKLSAARCARVSYEKQDKKDLVKDLEWFHKNITDNIASGDPPHVAPCEHPACATKNDMASNFGEGWLQLRKMIPMETRLEFGIHDLNFYEKLKDLPITEIN